MAEASFQVHHFRQLDGINFPHGSFKLGYNECLRDLADDIACFHLINKENGVGHIVFKGREFLLQPSRDSDDRRFRKNVSCAKPDETNEKEGRAQGIDEGKVGKYVFEPEDKEASQQYQDNSRGKQDKKFNETKELMTESQTLEKLRKAAIITIHVHRCHRHTLVGTTTISHAVMHINTYRQAA